MPDKKPHTIALRLTHDEYRGLQKFFIHGQYASVTEALRALIPVDELAKTGRQEAHNGDE